MLVTLSLHKGTVYIPTAYRVHGEYISYQHAPIAVVPAMDARGLRHAILTSIDRGNPEVSVDRYRDLLRTKTGSMLDATGCKSPYALDREITGSWNISERDGIYRIAVYRPMSGHGWTEDVKEEVQFPPDTPVEAVIARTVGMIQTRQRQQQQSP